MKDIWLISMIKAILVARPVTAAAQSHILRAKTCNETFAGTTDTLTLSFCAGGSNCITGSGNAYNLYDELMPDGTWNNFSVPVEYNPTVMVVKIAGSDAWCIEQMVWDGGPNLLGRGGRVYLDHDTGIDGCNYDVHHQTGWFYPCKQQWRFFNLQGAEDFKYEVSVKSCGNGGSSRVKASLCSESMCNEEAGELVTFHLEVNGKNKKWTKKHVSVNFNPVAMKLTGAGKPWCAEDMVINGFRILDLTGGPRIEMSGNPIEEQYFYNLQRQDVKDLTSGSSGGKDSFAQTGWMVLTEVIIAVTASLVLYATVGVSSFLSRKVLSCLSPRATDENLDNDDERPMCEECRHRRDTPLCPSTTTGISSGTGSLIRYSEQELAGSANELGSVHESSPSGKGSFYLGKPTLKRCQRKRLLQTRTLSSKSLDDNEESPPGWKLGDSPRLTGDNLSIEMTRTHLWPLSSPVLERVDTSHLWSNGEAKGAPGGNEPSQHKLSERTRQVSGEDIWDSTTAQMACMEVVKN